MAVAIFDYAAWALRFPALAAKVSQPLATAYFQEAGDFLDNTDASPIADVAQRLRYLNLLVAHIAAINGATAAGAAGIVGRISSVSEGSVTISSDYTATPGSHAWYLQTQWGAEYWALTAGFRTFMYVPGQQPYEGVSGPGGIFGMYGQMDGALRWP
jgi:hypothetical protein